MKNLLVLLLAFVALSGCKSTYDITLNNGKRVENVSKPVFDEPTGQYRFKMANGQDVKISSSRVRLIEPHGDSSEPQFGSPTKKK